MNCLECQETLQRRLDGLPIAANEALDRHLAQCSVCRERHASARLLVAGLQAIPRPNPPPGLAPRIVAAVVRDRQRRRLRMRRSLGVTAALAAAILIMLVVTYIHRPASDVDSGLIVNDHKPPRKVPIPPIGDKPQGPANRDEGAQTFAALTGRLADKTLDQAKVLWTVANPVEGVPIADLPKVEQLDPAAEPLRQAKQEVSESFHAVTHSARRAFDYFAREMPMFDMPPPEPK
jgi:hypothetical protein